MTYDLIGDVHGQFDRLKSVLKRMGYAKNEGVYQQDGHRAIFVGDLIDRGPDSDKVVELVKRMVEGGFAEAILGNHEYNWVSYNYQHKKGFLRPHTTKNNKQVVETIRSYEGKPNKLQSHLEWMAQLPLFIEKKKFRVVHACWDRKSIQYLKKHDLVQCSMASIRDTYRRDSKLKDVYQMLLSGPEINLPDGVNIKDTDGYPRFRFRYKWWLSSKNLTYRQMAIKHHSRVPPIPLQLNGLKDRSYPADEKPVFFGHYSMFGPPRIVAKNVCCLDWVKKTNRIVVYRFDSKKINKKNLYSFY